MRSTNLAKAREILDLAASEDVSVIVNREEWEATLKGAGHDQLNRDRWYNIAHPWKADIMALLTGDPWLYL